MKNLLIFSCNSLVRSDNRFGEFYRKRRDRGDAARQGTQGGRKEEIEGDLRDHAG